MKKTLILLFVCLLGISASFAQEKETTTKEEGYKFRNLKEIPITSVKDQHRAGTCWCYVILHNRPNTSSKVVGTLWFYRNRVSCPRFRITSL